MIDLLPGGNPQRAPTPPCVSQTSPTWQTCPITVSSSCRRQVRWQVHRRETEIAESNGTTVASRSGSLPTEWQLRPKRRTILNSKRASERVEIETRPLAICKGAGLIKFKPLSVRLLQSLFFENGRKRLFLQRPRPSCAAKDASKTRNRRDSTGTARNADSSIRIGRLGRYSGPQQTVGSFPIHDSRKESNRILKKVLQPALCTRIFDSALADRQLMLDGAQSNPAREAAQEANMLIEKT